MSDNDAMRRFRDSMVMDFDKWHDGTPYDLDALDALTAGERAEVARELASKSTLDWRDVQALERIGTSDALTRIDQAAAAQTDHGGAKAFLSNARSGWTAETEGRFIAVLEAARLMETSLDSLFSVAEFHPTPQVQASLLRLATAGEPSVRYAFGAFLLYLHGHSDEWYGLDDFHRPHLLGLAEDDEVRAEAEAWLRRMIEAPVRAPDDAA
jgi:hypothetical protein